MATDFRNVSIGIPSGTGRRSIEGSATFDSAFQKANVALNGFKLDYVSSDHHINIVEADTDILLSPGIPLIFGYSVTTMIRTSMTLTLVM